MRFLLALAAVTGAIVVPAGSVLAQDPANRPRPKAEEKRRRPPESLRPDRVPPAEGAGRPASRLVGPELFRMLDSNGDGKLSREELTKAADVLMKLDRNGDGLLTPDEVGEGFRPAADLPPNVPAGGAGTKLASNIIRRADKNGDGKLSKDELPEMMRDRFEEMDTNHDGFVDEQELSHGLAQLRKLREQLETLRGRTAPNESAGPGADARVEANRERIAAFLRKYDKDADGRISPSEFPAERADEFKKLDRNGDGYLTPEELTVSGSQGPP